LGSGGVLVLGMKAKDLNIVVAHVTEEHYFYERSMPRCVERRVGLEYSEQRNMLQKKKAAEMFLGDLITDNLCQFEKSQRLEFLLEYEKTIKDQRKLSIKEWSSLMYLYAVNFKPIPFLKFIRRLFIGIFSR